MGRLNSFREQDVAGSTPTLGCASGGGSGEHGSCLEAKSVVQFFCRVWSIIVEMLFCRSCCGLCVHVTQYYSVRNRSLSEGGVLSRLWSGDEVDDIGGRTVALACDRCLLAVRMSACDLETTGFLLVYFTHIQVRV